MASFWTQSEAMILKNLTYQKRNIWSNVVLILLPVVVMSLLSSTQYLRNQYKPNPSDEIITTIPRWPPLLQVPSTQFRAVKSNSVPYKDLPDGSCRTTGSCPATILITGKNRTFAQGVAQYFFGNASFNSKDFQNLSTLADYVLGTDKPSHETFKRDSAFSGGKPSIFFVQPECPANSTFSVNIQDGGTKDVVFSCVQGLTLWRNSSSELNDELFKGYQKGNKEGNINEIMGAYDFLDSNPKKFNVKLLYNSTYKDTENFRSNMLRISRAENMVTNAHLQSLLGPTAKITLEYIGEMSISNEAPSDIIESIYAPVMFTWIILQLFPVICSSLVYEKQEKLRIMMKMHGLGETAYWVNSYLYFLVMSTLYVCIFVGFGRLTGLHVFTVLDLSVQFVFYFVYVNLQISFAFLLSMLFSDVMTVSVISYIMVYATGLLGAGLFKGLVDYVTFPRIWVIVMELYPGFAFYRGIDEMVKYSAMAAKTGTHGILWKSLSGRESGIRDVLIIMAVEWFVFLMAAVYLGTAISFFRKIYEKMSTHRPQIPDEYFDYMLDDERKKVKLLLRHPQEEYSTICDNMTKVYPGKHGNQDIPAVKGLYLALRKRECFGLLGPDGSGKTSFINMMTGLTKPSSGTAWVEGLDLQTQMDEIYASFGMCPQNDLLWDKLSGREHLLFYGRLKNLRGGALTQAVEESLRSVNLFDGGVADKLAGNYSRGMRRRLSVAISLIGDPKIVYMDEPSSGVDLASRKMLWKVVKEAKKDRLIILATHSVEEAEHLCDRIGILVKGVFHALGSPSEVKAPYINTYVLTVIATPGSRHKVAKLARDIYENATEMKPSAYGLHKYQMPKDDVKISTVNPKVKHAKETFDIQGWKFGEITFEDVYTKVVSLNQI